MLQHRPSLSRSQICDVFHLIQELVEDGRDPQQWRAHLLERLSEMTGAQTGIVCEHYINPADSMDTRLIGLVEYGWRPEQQALFHKHLNAGGMVHDPLHAVVQKMDFRSFTRSRREMVPDEIWYASSTVDPVRRECDVDDTIHSRCRLPQRGWAQAITLMRGWGVEPFGTRDRLIVNLLHRELGRLWLQMDNCPLLLLPPRLRQTLDLIFGGCTEKEIASMLNVSIHTAHDFCRRLYRHFSVSGRGHLLTNRSCRQLLLRPALSPAYYSVDRGETTGTFPAR